jgi:hypothetical protein
MKIVATIEFVIPEGSRNKEDMAEIWGEIKYGLQVATNHVANLLNDIKVELKEIP